jgi:dimethylglycine dehydrogenase
MAGRLPKPGRISLSPMLSYRGKLCGDLTVTCLDENEFIVFGSGAAQEMHRRWFESHLGKFNVNYNNRSDEFHGLSIAGPNSRKVLEKIVREIFQMKNLNLEIREECLLEVSQQLLIEFHLQENLVMKFM